MLSKLHVDLWHSGAKGYYPSCSILPECSQSRTVHTSMFCTVFQYNFSFIVSFSLSIIPWWFSCQRKPETWVQSLGWEDPLEKEMATHSSTLAWKIPWVEEHGRLQSMGSQRVGHDWATLLALLCFAFPLWVLHGLYGKDSLWFNHIHDSPSTMMTVVYTVSSHTQVLLLGWILPLSDWPVSLFYQDLHKTILLPNGVFPKDLFRCHAKEILLGMSY